MEINYPLTDANMTYDYENHMYILTPDYMNREFGIDLSEVLEMTDVTNVADMPRIWLKRVSKYVYNLLYSNTFNWRVKEYYFAKDGNWRRFIKEWLGEMALYMLNNGDIGLQAGVSFDKNMSTNLTQVRGENMYPALMLQSMKATGALYGGTMAFIGSLDYEEGGY